MGIKNNLTAGFAFFTGICCYTAAQAATVSMNTARLQALDKITGKMSMIEAPVNAEIKFGSFSIVVRSCQTTPPEETPENYAFVDVADTARDGKVYNIFKGWMISSSPSLNSVEHPIYDVWLRKCVNSKVDNNHLMSPQELAARDNIEKYAQQDLSKEAIIAIEVQEEQARQEEIAKAEQEEIDRKKEEAKEAVAREREIEKEIEYSQEPAAEDMPVDGDGPVSLLNIGRSSSAAPATAETEAATEMSDTVEELPQIQHSESEGNILLEDTHHETIEQDLNLPSDIDEIIPYKN